MEYLLLAAITFLGIYTTIRLVHRTDKKTPIVELSNPPHQEPLHKDLVGDRFRVNKEEELYLPLHGRSVRFTYTGLGKVLVSTEGYYIHHSTIDAELYIFKLRGIHRIYEHTADLTHLRYTFEITSQEDLLKYVIKTIEELDELHDMDYLLKQRLGMDQ